jgi:ABC-type uncharacterized transport system permease subunit
MKTIGLLVALSMCQGCIAVGAISGAMIGTLAPVLIAADQDKEPVPSTVVLTTLIGAGIGTLLGILSVEDRKNAKAPPDDDEDDEEPDRGDDDE